MDDMNYRGVINMLVMCGCVGQSGGGWSHYVGRKKLRPQPAGRRSPSASTGRPPRQHELHLVLLRSHRPVALRDADDVEGNLSPTARKGLVGRLASSTTMLRAERMGWLPSPAAQRPTRSMADADGPHPGVETKDYVAQALKWAN